MANSMERYLDLVGDKVPEKEAMEIMGKVSCLEGLYLREK